jgi:predicted dehydrogenase
MTEKLLSFPQEHVQAALPLPRLGFAGVGWIGRNRMMAISEAGAAHITAVADPMVDPDSLPEESCFAASFEDLLEMDLDGVVIATPSALHASQSIAAIEKGLAVFCQKPLGRHHAECLEVIEAAREADVLLGVDLSYRHTRAMQAVRHLVQAGGIGRVVAIEAEFHNAYGPDKAWFYSRAEAGGGCLLDLGIHLVDLALWCLDDSVVERAEGWIREADEGVAGDRVEAYAQGLLRLSGGIGMQIACSWKSHAGQDAVIGMRIFGTEGGVAFRNINGSFYDFVAETYANGWQREMLTGPPDAWGGRAAVAWARQLARDPGYDPSVARVADAALALDLIYRSARS